MLRARFPPEAQTVYFGEDGTPVLKAWRFDHFLHGMARGVTVVCGVRPGFATAMRNLRFQDWLPADRIFVEEGEKFSATLKAVRYI